MSKVSQKRCCREQQSATLLLFKPTRSPLLPSRSRHHAPTPTASQLSLATVKTYSCALTLKRSHSSLTLAASALDTQRYPESVLVQPLGGVV